MKTLQNKINKALKTASIRPMMENGFRARRVDAVAGKFEVTTDNGHVTFATKEQVKSWIA